MPVLAEFGQLDMLRVLFQMRVNNSKHGVKITHCLMCCIPKYALLVYVGRINFLQNYCAQEYPWVSVQIHCCEKISENEEGNVV
jgi:hypothetical protein